MMVKRREEVADALQDGLGLSMGLAKLLVGPLALGDVAVDREVAGDLVLLSSQRDADELDVDGRPVLARDGHLATPASVLGKLSTHLVSPLFAEARYSHLIDVPTNDLRRVPAVEPLGPLVPDRKK